MARFVVDSGNRLQEAELSEFPRQPKLLRVLASILSYVFHPVFVPVYIVLFLVYVHPYLFAGLSDWDKTTKVLQAFLMFTFFPLVTVLLLKAVGFIDTIFLRTQKDRIIPYVVCGIWYFWIWYVWRNLDGIPKEAVSLTLAVFIASSVALIANIYFKISMHAIAMGIMLAFFMLNFAAQPGFALYIGLVLLIAGSVCTARFIVSGHTQRDVYLGLFLGIFAQWVAFLIA